MNALDARNALFGTRREFPRRSRIHAHTHVATVYKYASHLSLCSLSLVVGFALPESSVFERVHAYRLASRQAETNG